MDKQHIKWIYLALLAFIWGSSFILIKRGLVGLSPTQVGSLRIVAAAIFLLSIGLRRIAWIPLHQWKFLALTGALGTFFPASFFAVAQTEIDSLISSILNSLTPLNTLVIGSFAFGYQFKRTQIIGVVVGFFGTTILILNGAVEHPEQNYYFALLLLVATICYATNVNLINKYLSDLSPLSISVGNFTLMLVPALVILFFSGFFDSIQEDEVQRSAAFIMILGIIGTGLANIIFFRLIQTASPVFATSVTYLIPLVAFTWGMFDHESLSYVQLIGASIIFVGVYLTSKK